MTTYYALDPLEVGDVVCRAAPAFPDALTDAVWVKLATPEALEEAGAPLSIVRVAAEEGAKVDLWRRIHGPVPADYTGLPEEDGFAIVGADGRAELVATLSVDDFPLGTVLAGALTLDPRGRVETLPEDGTTLVPVGVTAAEINAALLLGDVRLAAGTYELEAPIEVPTGRSLIGAGSARTHLLPTYSPDASLADDPANALILVRGVEDTALLNLTNPPSAGLASPALKDNDSLTLTDPGVLDVGDVFRIKGHNDGAQEHTNISSGFNISLCEMFEVASTYAGGAVIPVTSAILQQHAVTNGALAGSEQISVVGVKPVDDAVIQGINLQCDGGTVAVGILCQYARRPTIRDIAGAGFSRAMIELSHGTRDFVVCYVTDRGENNCVLRMSSAMAGRFYHFRSVPNGKRFHANGRIFGQLYQRDRCTNVYGDDVHLRDGCTGMVRIGGVDCSLTNSTFRDTLDTERVARTVLLDGTATDVLACGIQEGNADITTNENGKNWRYSNVHCINCRQSTPGYVDALGSVSRCAWFAHDQQDSQYVNCSVVNDGVSPQTAGRFATGWRLQDTNGQMSNVYVQGCDFGFRTTGVHSDYQIDFLRIRAEDGNPLDGNATLGIDFAHGGGQSGLGPRIGKIEIINVTVPWLFNAGGALSGSSLNDFTGDYAKLCDELTFDGSWGNVHFAKAGDASVNVQGYLCEVIDVSGHRGVQAVSSPATNTRSKGIVPYPTASFGLRNDFVLLSLLPTFARVLCTTAAVVRGDLMVASATAGRAEANNSPSSPLLVIGRAGASKAGGAEGLVPLEQA